MVVEVADTSLAYDQNVKTVLYAQAGIEEYWLVNLMGNVVTLYRQPEEGVYRSVQTAAKGESVSPPAFPDVVVPVDAVLG